MPGAVRHPRLIAIPNTQVSNSDLHRSPMTNAMTPAQRRIHAAALKLFAEKGVGEVNISDLAEAAGVARGTIYNNLESIETLFNDVASELSTEMNERVLRSSPAGMDPAERLANGVRYYIRRAHEEPNWGKFLTRYAISSQSLRSLWAGPAAQDLTDGLKKKSL